MFTYGESAMTFIGAAIEQYRAQGYLKGLRVLSDDQIAVLQERIDAILSGGIAAFGARA